MLSNYQNNVFFLIRVSISSFDEKEDVKEHRLKIERLILAENVSAKSFNRTIAIIAKRSVSRQTMKSMLYMAYIGIKIISLFRVH